MRLLLEAGWCYRPKRVKPASFEPDNDEGVMSETG